MKRRNPRFGCVRIAQQISHTVSLDLDKDVVRRVLAQHYRPDGSSCNGPSWLTFIVQARDSLWSVDLLRSESILLRSYISTDHDPMFRFHRWPHLTFHRSDQRSPSGTAIPRKSCACNRTAPTKLPARRL
jgi:hypothetical protein